MTDGMHVTLDDLFIWIWMEMAVRKEERVALEKEKKLCQHLQANEEKALVSMAAQEGKPVTVVLLNVSDLDVLLTWHHAPKTKDAKKADKVQQRRTIL